MYHIFIKPERSIFTLQHLRALLNIKIVLILFFLNLLQANATSYGQKISLTVKNANLEEVFTLLRQETNYNFLYDPQVLKETSKISLSVKSSSLTDVLDLCFKEQPVTYTIDKNNVVIRKKNQATSQPHNVEIKVSGTVSDEKNLPLAGVTVSLKAGNRTVVTDTEGKFSINLPNGNNVLVFTYVGYESHEISVSKSQTLNIILKPTSATLGELVVIGYGAQKRENVTGAISSVKSKDLDVSVASNFSQTLQGKAAGVEVIQATGQPGANARVRIRVNPSNANAGVLYVIDGVPVNDMAGIPSSGGSNLSGTDQSPLNFINPNDIETIDFLKDAASASIYGARAGAGVVLITTKKGKSGTSIIQYNGSYGNQKVAKMFEVLDTKTYMEQINLLDQEKWMLNNRVAPFYGTTAIGSVTPFVPRFSQAQIDATGIQPNAMDAITRSGYTQQHNISLRGGNNKTTYFISGNYFDQKGVLLASDYKRYNSRINLDQVITDKLKVGFNLLSSNSTSLTTGTGGVYENGGIITAALYYPANLPLIAPDGTYPLNPRWQVTPNPLSFETVDNNASTFRLLTGAHINWEIISGLTAGANFSYDQSTAKRNTYLPTTFSKGAAVGGDATIGNNASNTKLLEYTLKYNRKIAEKHRLDALVGYSYNVTNGDNVYAQNQNFISDVFSYYNLGAGQSTTPGVGSGKYQTTWASYVARAIYTYDDKYTLQASIRRDGSDKFAENKKWGYFPSVSANWLISSEDFLKPLNFINLLKLRVSYGEVGNSNIGNNAFAAYGVGTSPIFGTNTINTGIVLTQAANPNLTWETASDLDFGLDFSLFNNRLSGAFDYYKRDIRDLLSYIPFPSDFTVNGVLGNSGKTRAVGYDIGVQTKNIVSNKDDGFNWSTNITFSHYKSYWVERSPNVLATLPRYINVSGKKALTNGYYGFISEGIYKGGDNKPAHMPNILPGTLILKDIHGYDAQGNLTGPDGMITAADQALTGNLDPKFSFGIGNNFSFKNFDLSIFFSGVSRKAISPYAPNGIYRIANLNANMGQFGYNTMPISLSRWTFQNPNADFPSGISDSRYSQFQNASDYWLVDASFLRCRNITLGYKLPSTWLQKQRVIKNMRISFDVQNPFTITSYPGLDPELSANNYYPLNRSYVLGIDLTF